MFKILAVVLTKMCESGVGMRQKRKAAMEDMPQALLQPSDSVASTLSEANHPFAKRRRMEQV